MESHRDPWFRWKRPIDACHRDKSQSSIRRASHYIINSATANATGKGTSLNRKKTEDRTSMKSRDRDRLIVLSITMYFPKDR